MVKVNVIFSFESNNIIIQCSNEDKMKDICQIFATKINLNINSLIFLYGGNQINFGLRFKEQANSFDKDNNEMRIVVTRADEDTFMCPKCGERIHLNTDRIDEIIRSNTNINDSIKGIKISIENMIKNSLVNSINIQLKNINILLNNIIEKIIENNQKLGKLLSDNQKIEYISNTSNTYSVNKNNYNSITSYNKNIISNENIHESNNFNPIYQKFMNSLSSLTNNNYEFPNIETILNYLSLNLIIGMEVFIIENSKLNYYFNCTKRVEESDIIPPHRISESIKYTFINIEICNYFNINNIVNLPKAFLFVNHSNSKRMNFIYYRNQNCLFNAINYKNNTFNLKRISNPNNNTISNTTTNSYYQRRQRAKYCIYFKCGDKEGFFEYNDNNMLLSEAYNKFREKYTEMPVSGHFFLMNETNMSDLEEYKSLKDNGIKDGDKIAIIIE